MSTATSSSSLLEGKPLEGIRIVDASHVFAIPYATALLCDLGAEVIKIQNTAKADVMAAVGPFPDNDPGERPWDRVGSLNTVNRGKLGLAIDITRPEGAELFRRLSDASDVVTESFTPRVLRKLALDYESLRKTNPRLIMLSNTGFGHTGPWREYGSVATSLEGTSGMCWLSGYEDGAPSKVGQSYTDFLACWNALYAILLALFHRHRSGRGQWIDIAMYQAGAATLGPQILDWESNRRVATRVGNSHAQMAPHGVYRCAGEDRWIAVAVDSDQAWQALCGMVGRAEWIQDAALASVEGRLKARRKIDAQLEQWTATQDAQQLAARLQANGIMAGPVQDGRDLFLDPQLRARGFLEPVQHSAESGIGCRPVIGRPWKMSGEALSITRPAPCLGEHNREVLARVLGLADSAIDELVEKGILRDELPAARGMRPLALEAMRKNHRIGRSDPDYRDNFPS